MDADGITYKITALLVAAAFVMFPSNAVVISGYVNNESAMILQGVDIRSYNGSIFENTTTLADGSYSINATPNQSLWLNVTAAGYYQYNVSFSVDTNTTSLNITIVSETPVMVGNGVCGVIHWGNLSGSTITYGNGTPIVNVTVQVKNNTTGSISNVTTNNAGYYVVDTLSNATTYILTPIKSGFVAVPSNYTVTFGGT